MQKMVDFHHNKRSNIIKLGCTLPNFSTIYFHKSTTAKFHLFTESDKDLLEKNREGMVREISIVFTREAVVDETFIRETTNLCKNFVGIGAIQVYPFSKCQAMPTDLYTKWEINSESVKFTPRQNKTRGFENMVMSNFQSVRPQCKVEYFYTTGTQINLIQTVFMAFVNTLTQCFKVWDAIIIVAYVRKLVLPSLRKQFRGAIKERAR